MSVRSGIDGDADTVCAGVPSRPSLLDPTYINGGESTLSTESAGGGAARPRRGRGPAEGVLTGIHPDVARRSSPSASISLASACSPGSATASSSASRS